MEMGEEEREGGREGIKVLRKLIQINVVPHFNQIR